MAGGPVGIGGSLISYIKCSSTLQRRNDVVYMILFSLSSPQKNSKKEMVSWRSGSAVRS